MLWTTPASPLPAGCQRKVLGALQPSWPQGMSLYLGPGQDLSKLVLLYDCNMGRKLLVDLLDSK